MERQTSTDTFVDERRVAQRLDLRLPIASLRSPRWSGETRNLSSRGVLLAATVELMVGQPVEYVVELDASGSGVLLHCWGRVVRRDSRGESPMFAVSIERYALSRRLSCDDSYLAE